MGKHFLLPLFFIVLTNFATAVGESTAANAPEVLPSWKAKLIQRKEEARKRRQEVEARLIEHHKKMIKYLETEPEKRAGFLKGELEKERLEQKQKVDTLRKELLEWKKNCTKTNSETVGEGTATSTNSKTVGEGTATSTNSKTVGEGTATSTNSKTVGEGTATSTNSKTVGEGTATSTNSESGTATSTNSKTVGEGTATSNASYTLARRPAADQPEKPIMDKSKSMVEENKPNIDQSEWMAEENNPNNGQSELTITKFDETSESKPTKTDSFNREQMTDFGPPQHDAAGAVSAVIGDGDISAEKPSEVAE
uniref:Uncharacterized protein n=1 Tax=Globodera pallida TaxID=36090 RepID=A0A183CAD5_GLOPA